MPNCIRCRKSIDMDGARFCPYCGAVQQRKRGTRQRGNGTGTAVKRGSTWEARLVIGWRTEEGKDHPLAITRSKRGFKTKREALEYIPQLRQAQRPKAPTLAHYWEIWSGDDMERIGESKRTAYKIAYRKLGRLVYRPIDEITVEDLRRTVAEACPSYYTARDARTVLKRLYELADADGVGNVRLPSYINLPQLQEREGTAFTEDEIRALWAAYDAGTEDCGYILIMIYTGMMPGELCALRKASIDLDARTITGAGMKTKVRQQTAIVLPRIIVPVIDALSTRSSSERFLPYNRDRFYVAYHVASSAAGVRDLPPYSCRHTTATALAVGENIAPAIIKKVMRWSSTRMLDRYAHADMQDAMDAVDTIPTK